MTKLVELSARSYKDQACFCLNAYWSTWGQNAADEVWGFTQSKV